MKKIFIAISLLSALSPIKAMESEVADRALDDKYFYKSSQDLLDAAAGGKIEEVKALLLPKADINVKNSDGNTPLHLAVINNHKNVITLLLEKHKKAGVLPPTWPENKNGNTWLSLIIYNDYKEIFEYLLNKKSPSKSLLKFCMIHAISAGKTEIGKVILEKIKFEPWEYRDFVQLAMDENQPKIIGLISPRFFSINNSWIWPKTLKNNYWTALHYASYKGLRRIAEYLLANNANPWVRTTRKENAKSKQLTRRSLGNDTKKQKKVVDSLKLKPISDSSEKTPLHLAAQTGHSTTCEALLKGSMLQIMETDFLDWIKTLKSQGIIVGSSKKEIISFVNKYFYIRLLKYIQSIDSSNTMASQYAKSSTRLNPEAKPIPLRIILSEDFFHVYFPYLIEKWFAEELNNLEEDH